MLAIFYGLVLKSGLQLKIHIRVQVLIGGLAWYQNFQSSKLRTMAQFVHSLGSSTAEFLGKNLFSQKPFSFVNVKPYS